MIDDWIDSIIMVIVRPCLLLEFIMLQITMFLCKKIMGEDSPPLPTGLPAATTPTTATMLSKKICGKNAKCKIQMQMQNANRLSINASFQRTC